MDRRSTAVVVALLWLVHPLALADLTAEERLRAGEVVVESVTNAEGVHGLRGRFIVRASRAAIWSMLTDYVRFRDLYKNLEDVQVLSETNEGVLLKYRIRVAWMRYEYVLSRRYETPGHRISWQRVEGDLRTVTGTWRVQDTVDPGQHLLDYESYVDVGTLVPTRLVAERASTEFVQTAERIRRHLMQPK